MLVVVEVAIETELLESELVLGLVGVLPVLEGEVGQVRVVLEHLVLHKFLVICVGGGVGMT